VSGRSSSELGFWRIIKKIKIKIRGKEGLRKKKQKTCSALTMRPARARDFEKAQELSAKQQALPGRKKKTKNSARSRGAGGQAFIFFSIEKLRR
jgi:hypothetical protein